MKRILILIMGLFVCISIRSQTHPTADKGCMILDQPGKRLARKIPGTAPGRMYQMSFKAVLEGCDSLLAGAHLQQSSTQWFYNSGEHRLIFTANDTLSLIFFYINTPCRVSICYVKVEEMRIESRVVCKEDSAGYRYGFNGQMKDDEVYGVEGTSYSFEYRAYDSRIGRFLSVDLLADNFAWNSPYTFAESDVIRAIDLEGLEKIIVGNSDATKDLYNTFTKVVNNDNILNEQLLTPITKPEHKDKINFYILSSSDIDYSITFDATKFETFIRGAYYFDQLSVAEKNQLRENDPEGYKGFRQQSQIVAENGLNYVQLEQEKLAGKTGHAIVISNTFFRKNQVKDLAHEIKLHAINNLNGVNKTPGQEHKEGYGEEYYKNGTNPMYSPKNDEVSPNSVMGEIFNRIDKVFEKLKIEDK
ncbi:MAG: hypothetical protein IBJ09_01590 [Bacteroidia bacterium]|nr:hypothetical protein [Bacteroidia bacterium]